MINLSNIRIPPTIALMIGLIAGLPMGYFYAKKDIGQAQAISNLDQVVEGDKKGVIINKDTNRLNSNTAILEHKVKSNETSILTPDNNDFSDEHYSRLQRKIKCAQSGTNCSD